MIRKNISLILIASFMLLALTNCCTTKNELKDETMKNTLSNVERPPSPGNAEIKCFVEEINKNGDKSFCKIKISSVLNYGSGTRPIGNGSIINLEYKDDIRSQLESFINNKQQVKLLISEVPGGMGLENSTSYRLIKIIK